MLSSLSQDVRYVLRTLRRSPGFAAAAIAPIALGIGINTGVFSMLNNVMYRPLPAPEPNELLSIYQDFRGVQKRSVHGARSMFSVPEYRAYRDGSRTLSGVTVYTKSWTVTLGGRFPQEIEGVLVACNYFDVLRLRPAIGTGFTSANCDVANAPPAVVLSHALWTRAFAADPEIVHKTITLNGLDVAVVGIAPEGFDGTELARAAFFAPVSLQPAIYPEQNYRQRPAGQLAHAPGPPTRRHGDRPGARRTDGRRQPDRPATARTIDDAADCAGDVAIPACRAP